MNQSTSNNTTVPDYDFPDPFGGQNGSSDEDLDYLYKNYQDIIEFTEDYIFVSEKLFWAVHFKRCPFHGPCTF